MRNMYPTLNIFLWLKRIRVSILCLMLSVVTGCGFSDWVRNPFGDDEDPRAPAELLDVVSETAINRNWRINVGNGQGDNYKKLTPVVDGGFVFAASDDGEIIAVNTINGDLMWQTEVENSITGGVGAGDGAGGCHDREPDAGRAHRRGRRGGQADAEGSGGRVRR